jgi:hypothetical protein
MNAFKLNKPAKHVPFPNMQVCRTATGSLQAKYPDLSSDACQSLIEQVLKTTRWAGCTSVCHGSHAAAKSHPCSACIACDYPRASYILILKVKIHKNIIGLLGVSGKASTQGAAGAAS